MISGKSGSGKDTFAQILKDLLKQNDKQTLIIHFADLVKFYATQYFQWNGEKDEEGRALLQKIGTTIMRGRYPTYWAEIVAKFIDAIGDLNFFDYILIPDWRFINEFETVYDYAKYFNQKVITVRINRKKENGDFYLNPIMTHEQYLHQSEIELDNFNFEWIIENTDKDLDNLCYAAEIFIKENNL